MMKKILIRYENFMICMSTSPILSLAAILTYYFQSTLSINPVTERIADSLILIGLAMVMEISSRILKTQRLAQHIQTITLSTALLFIILEFYSVFGPCCLDACHMLGCFGHDVNKKSMLVILLFVILFLIIYITPRTYILISQTPYYYGQIVVFLLLSITSFSVGKIITNRHRQVINQYEELHQSQERLSVI